MTIYAENLIQHPEKTNRTTELSRVHTRTICKSQVYHDILAMNNQKLKLKDKLQQQLKQEILSNICDFKKSHQTCTPKAINIKGLDKWTYVHESEDPILIQNNTKQNLRIFGGDGRWKGIDLSS